MNTLTIARAGQLYMQLMMASNSDLLKLISLHGDRAATISSIDCPKDHNSTCRS